MLNSFSAADLADLAQVARPSSPDSPGAVYLRADADRLLADLAEVGAGLHVACMRGAADEAVPLDDADAFAAFVDLEIWRESAHRAGARGRRSSARRGVGTRRQARCLRSSTVASRPLKQASGGEPELESEQRQSRSHERASRRRSAV